MSLQHLSNMHGLESLLHFFPWELRLKWGEILSGHFKNYFLCSGLCPLRAVAYMVINFESSQQMGSSWQNISFYSENFLHETVTSTTLYYKFSYHKFYNVIFFTYSECDTAKLRVPYVPSKCQGPLTQLRSHIPEFVSVDFPCGAFQYSHWKIIQQGELKICSFTVLFEILHIFHCFRIDFLNVAGIYSTKLSEFIVHTFIFDLTGLSVVLNVTFPELNLDLDHYDFSAIILDIIPADGNGTLQ